MKRLKAKFKALNEEEFRDIQRQKLRAKEHLNDVQALVQQDPLNEELRKYADDNIRYFHQSLKSRAQQNRILNIKDQYDTWHKGEDGVQEAFLKYYKSLLGTRMSDKRQVDMGLFYLWHGIGNNGMGGYVAWDEVCFPKKWGGLGLRNIRVCNQATMGRLAWEVAQKQDSLWVKRVHAIY
ncbi:hypothetical protein RDABS01_034872 [Bienertia sinuspersici]